MLGEGALNAFAFAPPADVARLERLRVLERRVLGDDVMTTYALGSALVFTGLVDDVGTIDRVAETEAGREFRILCGYDDLADGESIAVNGACLTVRAHGPGWFTVAAVSTTLGRTTIGGWQVGRRVNLERALRLGDRLGRAPRAGPRGRRGGACRTSRSAGDARLVDLALPRGAR